MDLDPGVQPEQPIDKGGDNEPGEGSLLDAAGRDSAQLGIRSTVWDPDTRIVDKGPTTLTILSAQPADSNIASAQAGQ